MPSGNDWGWRKHQHPIQREFSREKPFDAVTTTANSSDEARKANIEHRRSVPVQLPHHLFIPAGAESLDIRVAADVAANTTTPASLMSFTAPKGAVTHFISYGIFSDGSLAANQEFIPRVDGRRAFPYQGDPNDNFRINLGLAPDLSNTSLIQCQLTLNPDETIEWFVKNLNSVDIAMGVRMVGYIDYEMKRINARSGG